jgi:hypothetical protein
MDVGNSYGDEGASSVAIRRGPNRGTEKSAMCGVQGEVGGGRM